MYRVFGVKFLLYNVVYGNKKDRLTPVFFSGNNLSKLCDLGLVGFPENIQKRRLFADTLLIVVVDCKRFIKCFLHCTVRLYFMLVFYYGDVLIALLRRTPLQKRRKVHSVCLWIALYISS